MRSNLSRLRMLSIALKRPAETSHARGLAGTPSRGHCSIAALKASCIASSARSKSASGSAWQALGATPSDRWCPGLHECFQQRFLSLAVLDDVDGYVSYFTTRNLRCVTPGDSITIILSSSICSVPICSNNRIPSPSSTGTR